MRLRLGQCRRERGLLWVVGDLPDVQADADLLRPVLVNLMGNALKFARRYFAASDFVRDRCERRRAGEVTLDVRDNGVGFLARERARTQLVQPFTMRLHGRRFEGHGIGLSIVRRTPWSATAGGRRTRSPSAGRRSTFTLPKAA